MRTAMRRVIDWIDARTGVRRGVAALLHEPLPAGIGWWFTLGSVLLLLLAVQALTGVVLALYYAPTPDHAWDSVRFITSQVTFGRLVRNLHYFGASFIVVFAALHLLRVVAFGSYKPPRELTWISGVVLLLVVLAFALTGYLLPWDQRAYWATVVTVNIARSAPLAGELAAAIMRGGSELGALTLSRWYAVHVVVLPGVLVLLVVAHLFLMRRHRISGPPTPAPGIERPFYPHHAFKDALVAAAVFAALLVLALVRDAPLEPVADPTDPGYVPRPEWYFLWLFQLLKYFPGRLETIAAHGIPALLVALLVLLPFLDRRAERRAWRRPVLSSAVLLMGGTIVGLTWLGTLDAPAQERASGVWHVEALGGRWMSTQARCTRCHRPGGTGRPWERLRFERDDAWVAAHAADPEVIAPGVRPAPADALDPQQQRAVVAWTRAARTGVPAPAWDEGDTRALAVIGANCLRCHVLDGRGRAQRRVPALDRAGRDRDAAWLAAWIANPTAFEYDTDMPAFGDELAAEDIRRVAGYLARRK